MENSINFFSLSLQNVLLLKQMYPNTSIPFCVSPDWRFNEFFFWKKSSINIYIFFVFLNSLKFFPDSINFLAKWIYLFDLILSNPLILFIIFVFIFFIFTAIFLLRRIYEKLYCQLFVIYVWYHLQQLVDNLKHGYYIVLLIPTNRRFIKTKIKFRLLNFFGMVVLTVIIWNQWLN